MRRPAIIAGHAAAAAVSTPVHRRRGFAATNRVEPAAARAVAEQAVAIARANARLATLKVVLADTDKAVATWTSAFTRDAFEVPLDVKIAFLMKLNEAARAVPGVSFVSSPVLFVDEQKFFASSRRGTSRPSARHSGCRRSWCPR